MITFCFVLFFKAAVDKFEVRMKFSIPMPNERVVSMGVTD